LPYQFPVCRNEGKARFSDVQLGYRQKTEALQAKGGGWAVGRPGDLSSTESYAITLAIDAQTWSRFASLRAATHMRPLSVP
jgi:hypothetical protein